VQAENKITTHPEQRSQPEPRKSRAGPGNTERDDAGALAPSGGSLKLSSEQKSEERETQNRFRSEEHTQPQNKNGNETHKPESKILLHKNQTRFT
jgi:hypothetical protein